MAPVPIRDNILKTPTVLIVRITNSLPDQRRSTPVDDERSSPFVQGVSNSLPSPQAPSVSIEPKLAEASWTNWEPNVPRAMLKGLVPGPRYLVASELHNQPVPDHPVQPEYPAGADLLSGRITVLILINEKGGVDSAGILQADPEYIFDDSALKAFSQANYVPGKVAGIPVRSQLLVEVTYRPGEVPQAAPLESIPREEKPSIQASPLGKGN